MVSCFLRSAQPGKWGALMERALVLLSFLVVQGGLCEGYIVGALGDEHRVFHEGTGPAVFDFDALASPAHYFGGRKLVTSYTCERAPSGTCPSNLYTGCCNATGTCAGIYVNRNCNIGLPCAAGLAFSCCTDFQHYFFCPVGAGACQAPAAGFPSPTCGNGSVYSGTPYGACCVPDQTGGTCGAGPYKNVAGSCNCPTNSPWGSCCSEAVVDTYVCASASDPGVPAGAPTSTPLPITLARPSGGSSPAVPIAAGVGLGFLVWLLGVY
ncbi:hypothetical protein KFL_003310050 [Klebsormidium nitens]|uniref:Uncharacterized protein n=1 Tax=Klebsormidium nitens TaxID=105231 RepID=A0A1Y1I970_KLENI|nr:hypothetical protein KFL_003310050 [Klebsormidium nitens]|eukprot:GAQ87093.1 hypothetical protein KFL_003310050 [Klebsormidium nitens]